MLLMLMSLVRPDYDDVWRNTSTIRHLEHSKSSMTYDKQGNIVFPQKAKFIGIYLIDLPHNEVKCGQIDLTRNLIGSSSVTGHYDIFDVDLVFSQ